MSCPLARFVAATTGTLVAASLITAVPSNGSSRFGAKTHPTDLARLPEPLRARYVSELHRVSSAGKVEERLEQRALLEAVIAALPKGTIASARLEKPFPGARENPRIHAVGHTWLALTVRSQTVDGPGTAEAKWKGALVAGAFREASHVLKLDDLLGVSIDVVSPDARQSGTFASLIGQRFGRQTGRDESVLRRHLRAAIAKSFPSTRGTISFLNVYGLAAIVTLWLPNSAAVDARSAFQKVFANPDDFDGALLVLKNRSGVTVGATGSAMRTGIGTTASSN